LSSHPLFAQSEAGESGGRIIECNHQYQKAGNPFVHKHWQLAFVAQDTGLRNAKPAPKGAAQKMK
jgi:hypothetical protein